MSENSTNTIDGLPIPNWLASTIHGLTEMVYEILFENSIKQLQTQNEYY